MISFLKLLAITGSLLLMTLFQASATACSCGPNCQCGSSCQCSSPPAPESLRVRKNQSSLSDQEVADFVNAVLTLKSTFRPGSSLSVYDEFVQRHGEAFTGGHSHGGPAFLPWHRQFLLEFEDTLRQVNPNVTVPYWDFTVDNQATSSLWRPEFLGGNGDPNDNGIVKDGPFQQGDWKLQFDGPDLRRNFGVLLPTLPTAADVSAALGVPQYDAFPYDVGSPLDESFRNNLEGFNHPTGEAELHNRVHLWIGGSMAIIYSPNDPIFWLLHANIDRVWAEWQAIYGLDYLPVMGALPGQNLHDIMSPFHTAPADVLDHLALGYRYDTEIVPAPGGFALFALGAAALLIGRSRRRLGRRRAA